MTEDKQDKPHAHFWRTVERNGKWVTECESCPAILERPASQKAEVVSA